MTYTPLPPPSRGEFESFLLKLLRHCVVINKNNSQGGNKLARSNYKFNKRQKELARKKKKELKRQRKLDKNAINSEEDPNQSQNEGEDLSA